MTSPSFEQLLGVFSKFAVALEIRKEPPGRRRYIKRHILRDRATSEGLDTINCDWFPEASPSDAEM
jgi:hypothetical protein